jgi:hypothetical protein
MPGHDEDPPNEPGPAPARPRGGAAKGAIWLVSVVGAVVILLVGISAVGGWRDWVPSIGNPFQEEVTDRSQPALLRSIRDMSRFTAASGDFQVVIDVERSRRFIPDVIVGERTLFVAAGTVDAYVELESLADDAVTVDEETNSVVITLPPPQLAAPNIDNERSYVFAQQRGAANRLADFFRHDPDQHQQVLRLAEDRIAEAAEASELRQRAAENTSRMLEGMVTSLGFDEVTVEFSSP